MTYLLDDEELAAALVADWIPVLVDPHIVPPIPAPYVCTACGEPMVLDDGTHPTCDPREPLLDDAPAVTLWRDCASLVAIVEPSAAPQRRRGVAWRKRCDEPRHRWHECHECARAFLVAGNDRRGVVTVDGRRTTWAADVIARALT